jgi:oxygen-dependent protoporphyrinogen oxidase
VLAVPAPVALRLLEPIAPAAAAPLDALRSVSVVTVLAAYPKRSTAARPAFDGTGVLVPSDQRRFLKAATFLSRKWDHLATADLSLVRLSAGRAGGPETAELDDDELVDRLHADLADMTGLTRAPAFTHVQRWPGAMAQLQVGHPDRLAAIRRALRERPNLVVAGAPYDGIGLAACISSGRRGAAELATDRDRTTLVTP